jgi:hypothetical protein
MIITIIIVRFPIPTRDENTFDLIFKYDWAYQFSGLSGSKPWSFA